VLRKAQDKLKRESPVRQLSLQTWNAIAENVCDETNVLAGKTLKCKFMQKVGHMLISLDAYDDRILRATWRLSLDFTRKSRIHRNSF
jgi:hypothetical protein